MSSKAYAGTITFTKDVIDVTDPCYDQDVWGRSTLPIKPGEYTWWAVEDRGTYGTRIHSLAIFQKGSIPRRARGKTVAHIGVDAGLAGFFEDKPDYDDEEWMKICGFLKGRNVYVAEKENPFKCVGICSDSGCGDGEYEVVELYDTKGHWVGYKIIYIEGGNQYE